MGERTIIAVCSCHQHVYADNVELMTTHGMHPTAEGLHRWVYVNDIDLTIIRDTRCQKMSSTSSTTPTTDKSAHKPGGVK